MLLFILVYKVAISTFCGNKNSCDLIVISVGSGPIARTKDDSSIDNGKPGAQRKVQSELLWSDLRMHVQTCFFK